jgi:hypothetical protein
VVVVVMVVVVMVVVVMMVVVMVVVVMVVVLVVVTTRMCMGPVLLLRGLYFSRLVKKFPTFYETPKILYHLHKSQPRVLIQRQIILVRAILFF